MATHRTVLIQNFCFTVFWRNVSDNPGQQFLDRRIPLYELAMSDACLEAPPDGSKTLHWIRAFYPKINPNPALYDGS